MKKRKAPGELELSIIKVLREIKEGSVIDIQKALPNYAYTTLMTTLSRLYEKNELSRKKMKRSYVYFIKEKKKTISFIERIKKSLFRGKSAPLIQYLIESSNDVTEQELKEIQKLIEKKRKSQ
jgi:predicted transcriptional regulator